MSKNEKEVHVVMLPWLAFGHLIPYLDLSIALAKHGIHVSFLSTSRNIQRLPKIPLDLSPFIDFVPFSLPKLDSNPLPENAEATIDIPAEQMGRLKKACDHLQQPIKNFLANKLPNWLIVDFFPHWAVDIAQELKIPIITNSITTASTAVFFWTPELLEDPRQAAAGRSPRDLIFPPKWVDFPSKVACRDHETDMMHNVLYGVDETGFSGGARFAKLVNGSRALTVRTSPLFEGEYSKLLSEVTQRPVFPLGFLPPEKLSGTRRIKDEQPWSKILDWLDGRKPGSVVFVSFGSEHKLKKEEILEIAHGLELSGLSFLWALREPNLDEALPLGFAQRTVGRGVVQSGWSPQREILGHPSIGGSLFHAGWASIIETAIYGHSLVLLPFVIAQPLDTRLLVEKGLAVEVERGKDGIFTRDGIASALRKAMVSGEGERLRARAKEAAEGIFGNRKINDDCIGKFVDYLKSGAEEKELVF
ncbi:UDP-Glycosyltransferase superfamily protein [Striga asiatica]|uniref:UDP-Glycosyltransferase superfamily protein n=1 Tax=Striga asiatica TaxID=4170 RepID=A0A5A7QJS3_STRAF|nr:UDP-Glycosyltransferase superfamily protein [Striga asiatica]